MLALPIALAIVPALLLLWFFHSRDAYPEPPRVVWATFFLGILSIPAVLLLALPAGHLLEGLKSPYEFGFAEAFVCAAIPEEFFKFVVLSGYAARHIEFNEPMDGVVYGVAASLGFATLENILYVSSEGLGVGVMRAFTAVPGHAFTGVVMGYYVGRGRFASQQRGGLFGLALLLPILLHGMYDFPLLVISRFKKVLPGTALPGLMVLLVLVTIATLILEWRLALRLVRRMRFEQDESRGSERLAAAPVAAPDPGLALAPVLAPVLAPAPVGAPALVAAAPPPKSFSLLGWVQVLGGGTLLTGAGLLALLVVIGVLTSANPRAERDLVLGGAVLFVPPILVGFWLFRAGIRHLNRAESAVPR